MRFLTDECRDFAAVRTLREHGHDVLAVCEFQHQSWEVRLGSFRIFAIAILPNDAVDRHTASYHIEASITAFDKFLFHGETKFSVYPIA